MRVKSMIMMVVLSLLILLLLIPTSVSASQDNQGTEFLMGFLPNYGNNGNLAVHLTGDTSTNVTVEYPVGTVLGTYAVTPGSVTIVSIPAAAQQWANDTVAGRLVRATAPDEFVAYMVNIESATSDAALALPVDTMNTEYILSDYNALGSSYPAEFVVFAAYNNTTVTINPTANINGHAAGTPFSVVLNANEGYFNRTTDYQATLTGSIITADRPVGVTNGVECTNIPIGYYACDHTFEVAQPVQSWGTKIGVAGLPLRDTTFYRILASEDGTTVTQDGTIIATLDRGEYHEVGLGGNHVFEGDKPIYVVQYMPGQSYPGSHSTGDPAQGNMIPFDQYLTDYTFSTVGGSQFSQNFVTIIANNADVGTLLLDGSPILASNYSPIPTTNFSAALVSLTQGTHTTSSTNPHGITVEGYNTYDSYIYPGGAMFEFINPVGDSNPPIITLTPNAGPPPSADGVATDNRPSEDINSNGILDPGEDLNGNGLIDEDTGIFFVELDAGATNLVLTVAPFVPGDGVVNFTVSLSDPNSSGSGDILVTDGAGNVSLKHVTLGTPDQPVPEAPAIVLFGIGLIGIVGYVGFRRFRSRQVMVS